METLPPRSWQVPDHIPPRAEAAAHTPGPSIPRLSCGLYQASVFKPLNRRSEEEGLFSAGY